MEIENNSGAKSNNNLSSCGSKCFRRILVLCNYRERCEEELRIRLCDRENFSVKDFEEAINKAKSFNIVNDERYAEMYAFTKLNNHRGIAGVLEHFAKMKISWEGMPKVVDIVNRTKDNEVNIAVTYIKSHPSHSKDFYKGNVRKLINRGYSYEIALQASKIAFDKKLL